MMNAVIKDRVRYVVLLNYFIDQEPKLGEFRGIGQTYLREVVSAPQAGGGAGAPPVQAAGQAVAPSGRDSWQPLMSTSEHGGGAGPGGGLPGLGGPAGKGGPGRPEIGRGGPIRNPGGAPVMIGGAPAADNKQAKPRFEFVVMFFWQEPTPSDQLMNLTAAPAAGPAR
jgi:hypothetical protein